MEVRDESDRGSENLGAVSFEAATTSKPKSLLHNAFWVVVSTLWSTCVGFLLTPFLIARIGVHDYGLYVLLMTVSGLMGIMKLGLGEATLRYVAYHYGRDDLAGIKRVLGATLSVYVVTAGAAWAVLFFLAPVVVRVLALPESEMGIGVRLLRLTAISLAFGLVGSAFGSVPRALQRYDIDTKMGIVIGGFQAAGSVVLVLAGWGVRGLVFWGVMTSLLGLLLSGMIAKRLIPKISLLPKPSRAGLKEVFGYGVFSLARQVVNIVRDQADRLLLGILFNTETVAYLAVPRNLAFRGLTFTEFGSVLFPRFSAMTDRDAVARLYLLATWTMLCATVCLFVPLTVLFPDFLRLWINPDFARDSGLVAQLIAASCIVRGGFPASRDLLRGLGKPHYLAALNTAATLTNLAANLLLIPILGLAGAGITCCTDVFWGFLTIVLAWRTVSEMPSWKALMRIVGLPIGLGLGFLLVGLEVRAQLPLLDWPGLLLAGLVLAALAGGTIVGIEFFLGGCGSQARQLFQRLRHRW